MINIQSNIHGIQNNIQRGVYFGTFSPYIIFRPVFSVISFTPNWLKISNFNLNSDNFVQNPRKGNRMLVGGQNHPTPIPEVTKAQKRRYSRDNVHKRALAI